MTAATPRASDASRSAAGVETHASLPATFELACDVLVIGSGAGGSVVATELALAGFDVCVVEEGPHVPAEVHGRMRPSESLRHVWRDGALTLAVPRGDTPPINVTMGRCVGGSSMLTGGVCLRIPDRVLHRWSRELGIPRTSPDDMAPFMDAVEAAMSVEEVPVSMRSRSTELFAIGAERRGTPLHALRRNTRGCTGHGRCNFGCPNAAKQSVDLSYLPRAIGAGARVLSDCIVDRVLLERGRAIGATGRTLSGDGIRRTRGHFSIRARRVVVAASAAFTPILLGRSGVRSPHLGKHLTLHPSSRMLARFDEVVRGQEGALQSAFTDALEARGITLVGLFVPRGVLAATMPGVGPAHAERVRDLDRLAMFGALVHDEGGGRVGSLFGQPYMTYRMEKRDRAVLPEAMTVLAETFFAAGAREVFLPVLGLPPLDADAFRALDPTRIPSPRIECTSQHPLGTCRMAARPEDGVVDPDGRVYGVDELYVADGSVLPTSLGVNPQIGVMSMATRIARTMRERPLPKA